MIGVANGWAGDGKFLYLRPDDLEAAYTGLPTDCKIRGFAFWNIKDEGSVPKNDKSGKPVFMARGLNRFLNIRHHRRDEL